MRAAHPGPRTLTPRYGVPELIAQINIARQHRTGGFVVLEYDRQEVATILPQLAKGATRR